MIHVASLAVFVKKAYKEKAFQTNMEKIISQLHLAPSATGMDILVIAPKDLKIVTTKVDFLRAIKTKHQGIDVIMIYLDEDEVKELRDYDIILKKVKKLNLNYIKEALDELLEQKDIKQVETVVVSKDSLQPKAEKLDITAQIIEPDPEPVEIAAFEPQEETVIEEIPIPSPKKKTIEERVAECGEFADWKLFKQMLKKDSIIRELIQENNKFHGTVEIMLNLDKKIALIFKDPNKTAEERFEAIREAALQRTAFKEQQNNIIVEKVLNVMTAMITSAEATIDRRVNEITASLRTFEEASVVYYKKDREQLNALIEQRLDLQLSIHEIVKEIISLYQSMDETVAEVVADFDKNLPSENPYINEIYAPSSHLFVPENAAALTSKLMNDLQNNRIKLSVLEGSLMELVAKVFKLCELDESIINYQNRLIQLLTAKNVEDVVVVDTILKNCLRLYIGPQEVGTRATSITWAGILSRRHNTVLIDLTGKSKFMEYGVEAVGLEAFMAQRIEKQLLFVEGDVKGDMDYLQQVIEIIKTRLNYYPYVNIILNPDQTSIINELSENAISATFITDCTNRANSLIRSAVQELKIENIARQIVLIDPPEDPLPLLNDLTIDPLTSKLIVLPHISKMKSYSYRAIPPYKDKEIIEIFETSFR